MQKCLKTKISMFHYFSNTIDLPHYAKSLKRRISIFHYFSKTIVLPFYVKVIEKEDINISLVFQDYSLAALCKNA